MKSLRFLPLAFIAGVDGFDLFAPYLVLVLTVAPYVRRMVRRPRLAPAIAGSLAAPSQPAALPALAVS